MSIVSNENNGYRRTGLAVALGEMVANRRCKRGLSILEMSVRTRLHPSILELIESGDVMPRFDDVELLARALGHSSAAPLLKNAWLAEDVSVVLEGVAP
jgi:ribosome-binding protein aMBF1 (putative translation factor)